MTSDEFQKKYHPYCVPTQAEAEREAYEANKTLEVNPLGPAVAVYFESIGWGLMLDIPALTIRRLVH